MCRKSAPIVGYPVFAKRGQQMLQRTMLQLVKIANDAGWMLSKLFPLYQLA